ncbi:MAG: hypothetical protein HY566_00425 [Candidatus Kerfeldbacteria bacterium]|nr:hypothetical protein [Candidatus Kerfeldbacteria bacterium]
MSVKIGGGRVERIAVVTGETPAFVDARMMLFNARLGVVQHPEERAGSIVVPRWMQRRQRPNGTIHKDEKAFRNHRERVYTLVPSVYDAFRQCWHILYQYGIDLTMGEKAELDEAARALRAFNLKVIECEQKGKLSELRAATAELVSRTSALLGKPVSSTKESAVLHLLALGKGIDSRGRWNPSVLMARATKAHSLVRERLEQEVLSIDPHIQARQHVLVTMIQVAELRLGALDHFVHALLRRGTAQTVAGTSTLRATLAQQCAWFSQDLSAIDYHPYRIPCADLVRWLDELARLLRMRHPTHDASSVIRKRFLACSHALRTLAALKELERMNFRLLRYEHNKGPFPIAVIRRMYGNVRSLVFLADGPRNPDLCPPLAAGHIEALEPLLIPHKGVAPQRDDVRVIRWRCRMAAAALYSSPIPS